MRFKNVLLIAGLLVVSACDDGDVSGTPVDAMVVDAAGPGGAGGVGGEGGEGGEGGVGGVGGEGGVGGVGGDGGDGGMGGGGEGGEGGDGGVGGMPPMPACSDTLDNDEDGLVDADDPGCDGPEDDDETDPPILCANGVDDDDDGLIDLEDPGCADGADFTEDDPAVRPACANDADDDEDGSTDFPADVGCQAAGDDDEADEATPRACSNEADDDEDGLTDYPFDPGCAGPGDNDEVDPEGLPACGNGADDDADGLIDYPDDNGCTSAGDYDEALVCASNGHQILDLNVAVAADGYVDGTTVEAQATEQGSCGGMAGGEQMFLYRVAEPVARVTFTTIFEETVTPTVIYVRRACAGAEDLACNRGSGEVPGTTAVLERPEPGLYYVIVDTSSRMLGSGAFRLGASEEALPVCDDNIDNDDDGNTDFPADPGCESAEDDDETSPDPLPACADGIDNDDDELVDFPDDLDCEAAFDDSENRVGCDANPNLIVVDNVSGLFNVNLSANPAGYTASCGNQASGPEQVFLVRVAQPSGLRVEMLPTADGNRFDTVLHMRANVCDMAPELVCNDDGGDGTLSLITLNNVQPGDYYVFADTYGNGPGGPISVQIDVVPLGAACENGQDDDADGLSDGEDPGCASPDDDDEADLDPPVVAACANGVDDDDDGRIDFMLDPGCTGVGDDDEADPDPAAACGNGIDDDNDGLIDMADAGCASVGDLSEANGLQAPACANNADDDGDGFVDSEDPGCAGPGDLNEADPLLAAACANGVDDDEDLLIDFPRDPGCISPGDLDETDNDMPPACADGLDNDEDGLTDFPDEPGCSAAADDDEADPDPQPACGNGLDDDADGDVDFPADPGCDFAADDNEINPAACANGADDDDDGVIDLDDPGCFGALDDDETDGDVAACGNGEDDDGDGDIDFPLDAQCQGAGDPREDALCGDIDLPTIHVGQAGGQINFVPLPGGNLVEGDCIFGSEGNETLIVLTLEQTSTVTATFEGAERVARWLRTTCDDIGSEVACESGFSNDPLSLFRAPPGDYYFFVETDNGGVPAPISANFEIVPFVRACADGLDNDDDGLVDFNDPGCRSPDDSDETDAAFAPVCNDGIDNDDDGEVDLADPDCTYAGGTSEAALCADLDTALIEIDREGGIFDFVLEDGEGVAEGSCDQGGAKEQVFALTLDERSHVNVVVEDPGGVAPAIIYIRSICGNPGSEVGCEDNGFPASGRLNVRDLEAGTYYIFVERGGFDSADIYTATISVQSAVTECNDEVDNDEDGLIDLLDPGCEDGNDDTEIDPIEVPECANGVDDDEDGLTDFPEDFGCAAAGDLGESLACLATEDVIEVRVDLAAAPLVLDYDTSNGEGLFDATCAGSSTSPEQAFAIVVDQPAAGFIEITQAGYDTSLHMRSACDDPGAELECNDDGGAGLLSRLSFVRLQPGIYYVFADGFGANNSGPGQLTVALTPAAAACGNGIDDDGDTLIDENDPGCEGPDDDDEFNEPLPQCSNRIDDDDDGLIDADDDGCDSPDDDDEFVPPECGDGNIEGIENCDDGNADSGDGCSDACQFEAEPALGTVRLKDGPAGNFGRLEIFANGVWGTVCDDGWFGEQGLINGDVACQELGFLGVGEVVLDGYDGADPTPILLDDTACVGDEESLIDCPAAPIGQENCSHFEDFALRCLQPGECRISAQCDGGLDCVDGTCGVAPPECSNEIDDDDDGLIDADDDGCEGPDDDSEFVPPECGDGIIEGAENCDDGNAENGDGCDDTCQFEEAPLDGAIRLKDGPAGNIGRLEVYTADAWGTVCDDLWTDEQAFLNADVACQQLGYQGAAE
ncbi:MAG: cysteine-rich repeat protein, partial [Bradymonadia bacterium]